MCFSSITFLLHSSLVFSLAFADVGPVVTLSNGGQLEGIHQNTLKGRKVHAFQGIQYGKAKRFANPEPADPWTGLRDAGSPSPFCLQYNAFAALQTDPTEAITGIEDCLFLDIVTPHKLPQNNSSLLPVVVLIPSGNFVSLGARAFGGQFLLDHDIVYVSINSRVGILGYLSTEDAVIPGNYGLKDQALALRWVRDNIRAFGGDPARVTLVGESSGGSCVHYHYFSPLSKGLFQRGVAMSGSVGNYWAQMAEARNKAQKLGTLMNCSDVQDSRKLRECLLSKDGKALTAQYEKFASSAGTPFAPVIEVSSSGAFITSNPLTMIELKQAADLPLILSSVQGEGLLTGAAFLVNPESLKSVESSWTSSASTPALLDYQETIEPGKINFVSHKIKNHYFGGSALSNKTLPTLIKALGDRSTVSDLVYTALLQAFHNTAPVYFNVFKYLGSANSATLLGATLDQLKPFGPCHGDDVAYMFNTTYLQTANTEEDIAVVKSMVNIIASFATTGKPAFGPKVEWKPVCKKGVSSKVINFLQIHSQSNYEMKSERNLGDFEFWQSLPLKEPAAKRASH